MSAHDPTAPSVDRLPKHLQEALDASYGGQRIPIYMWEPIAVYLLTGRIPGSFLQSVITNDLYMAAAHADEQNVHNLRAYAGFFAGLATVPCCGSREKMQEWHEIGGMEGAIAKRSFKPSEG